MRQDNKLLQLWNDRLPNHRANAHEWNDWTWQCRHSIGDLEIVARLLSIDEHEVLGARECHRDFAFAVSPFYLAAVLRQSQETGSDSVRPLVRTFWPNVSELGKSRIVINDGMGEDGTSPLQFISQLYPDRALLFISSVCPQYCRYCFRRRKVGPGRSAVRWDRIIAAVEGIKNDKSIRDVILSGGEPLMVGDGKLVALLKLLRSIDHVKIIRIDTKCPVYMPQRISKGLVAELAALQPIYISIHFTHPMEVFPETAEVLTRLADAGIPMLSYMPLLRGVNDDAATLEELWFKLACLRVRPYYLVQNVMDRWTNHFAVPLEKGLEVMRGIHGRLSGPAVPEYIAYLPGGGGKVPIQETCLIRKIKDGYVFRNFQGREIIYPFVPEEE